MALTKKEIARRVLVHLENVGIKLNDHDKERLVEQNIMTMLGTVCKAANTMSVSRFNVNVNKKWFHSNTDNKDKPHFKVENSGPQIEFENVLFPARHSLFILNYLRLRECCMELELDRKDWFNSSTWGIELDEESETFNWAGGNTKRFKIRKVTSIEAFKNESFQAPLAYDIADQSQQERVLVPTKNAKTVISNEANSDDSKTEIKTNEKEIGLKWYYYYIAFILPLGGLFSFIEAKVLYDKNTIIIAIMFLFLGIIQFIVAIGLRWMKLWAFYTNVALIAIAIITASKTDKGYPEFIGSIIAIVLFWYLPNYIYWKKRIFLFK